MQVKKNTLLLLACLVWTAAGVNILRIGLLAYATQVSLPHILLSLLVFFLFQAFVFGRLVGKHTRRILGYWEDRQFFLRFFDKKSFLIMAGMMSLGMFLRVSGLAPDPFLAVFYSGLGASLLLAGLLFGRNYGRALRAARPRPPLSVKAKAGKTRLCLHLHLIVGVSLQRFQGDLFPRRHGQLVHHKVVLVIPHPECDRAVAVGIQGDRPLCK